MILAIWEGTSHRQILDGMEVVERKQAHKLLFERLSDTASPEEMQEIEIRVSEHLKLPAGEREAHAESLFRRLAIFAAETLSAKYPQ